jgi:predicted PurR-regulated permease PerM
MTIGRFLRIVMLVAVVAVAYFVLDSLSGVLLPFAIAWLFAYLLQPLVAFIQHKLRFKYRMLSIIVALLLICVFIYGCIMLVVPSIYNELVMLKDLALSLISKNLTNSTIPEPVMEFFMNLVEDNDFKSLLNTEFGTEINKMILDRLQMIIFGTVDVMQALFAFFIILLYLFFILLDFERLSESWTLYIPQRWRSVAIKLWDDLVEGMNQYFRGQALVAFFVGVMFSIGFIIIDFPAAIAFGLFIGMLNIIPYLQAVSIVPMVLLAMLKSANTGDDFWVILGSALIVLVVVQVIQDTFLVPRIMGKRMNLHPAVILLSLSIWGHLLGLLGMIVALPLTTLLLGYLKRYHEIASTFNYSEEQIFKEAIDSTVFVKRSRGNHGSNAETKDTDGDVDPDEQKTE